MFIVSLTYKKPIEEVEKYIKEHILFLDKYYAQKKFIFSGRKNPRIGGIILAYNLSEIELENVLKEDPFHKYEIAEYEVTEVVPSKYALEFESFIEKEIK